MLCWPEGGSSVITLAGIDPGTTNLGFAVLGYDARTKEILFTEAMSFNSEKMSLSDDYVAQTHTERTVRIQAQRLNLIRVFKYYKPSSISCESPFYNRLRPSAYGPLVEVLSAINTATIEFDPYVQFTLYPPSIIKKNLGGSAYADKVSVKAQILLIHGLMYRGHIPIDCLDEHAIDALATVYCHYKQTVGSTNDV